MTVRLSDVKTPETIEEFRENLKRFCLSIGEDRLYVRETDGIKYSEISSMGSLYDITGKNRVEISPKVDLDMKTVSNYMNETEQYVSCFRLFEDENNFTLYDDTNEFLENSKNVKWISLDNKIYRELYMKLFGSFSGYINS
jgi:hypothetical protein